MVDLIKQIGEWQAATFPNATLAGALAHLERERRELAEEMADVAFMRIQRWRLEGVSCEGIAERVGNDCETARIIGIDLEAALRAKLAKNRARTWPTTPNAAGYFEHLKGEASP